MWACDPYLKSNRPRFSPISTCSFTGNAKSSTKSKRWLLQTLRSDGICMTDITTWFCAMCIDHSHIIVTTYWLTESTHKSTSEIRPFSFPYHPMTPDLLNYSEMDQFLAVSCLQWNCIISYLKGLGDKKLKPFHALLPMISSLMGKPNAWGAFHSCKLHVAILFSACRSVRDFVSILYCACTAHKIIMVIMWA